MADVSVAARETPHPGTDLEARAHKDLSNEIPFRSALMVALAAGMGYGFDAYAVNLYSIILPTIVVSLGISTFTSGVIGSLFLVGYTIGTVGFGVAADRFGRKDTLGVSILLYGLTTSLGGLFGSIPWLFTVMRVLTGIGGAGELAVGAPYTCEMFKSRHRALGTGGIIFSLYSLGYIVAGVVALALVPSWGWKAAFIIAIVPSVLVFIFRRFISESVRYVVDKAENKFEAAQALLKAQREAQTTVARAAAVEQIEKEEAKVDTPAALGLAQTSTGGRTGPSTPLVVVLGLISIAGLFIGLLTHIPKGAAAALVTLSALAILGVAALYSFQRTEKEQVWHIPGVRKRIGIGWLVYTANAMGYWGITTFLTTFMVKKFGVSPTRAIDYAIMFYGAQFFMSYIGTGLSDWKGRRPIAILGAVIMMACTAIAATSSSLSLFLVFGALTVAMLGWLWGVSDTYLSELFPTSIRGSGFGIAVGGGRVMSIAAPFLVGAGIAAFGPTAPFLATAGLWILTIIGYLLGPETARKPLEQLEYEFELIGAPKHGETSNTA
jgi:putative MFS transporter